MAAKDGERFVPLNIPPPSSRSADEWIQFDRLAKISNGIKTSKYTPVTFVPKNMFEQFHKQANLYFLVISCVMYIGEKTPLFIGTIKAWSTVAMLAMMMSVSGFIAAVDDVRRHRSDAAINQKKATVVRYGSGGKQEEQKGWHQVKVGDIVRVKNKEELPADIVALSCSGPDGLCYVSTANLDGEANLKAKVAVLGNRDLRDFQAKVHAEPPQKSIYSFNGSLTEGSNATPLGHKNLLLRGTVLRNTEWCEGLVVYTGADTRVMMNSHKVPMKLANIELVINKAMWVAVATQALMALAVVVVVIGVEHFQYRGFWYLYPSGYEKPREQLPDPIAFWITFFVLFSNLMPVSLYATMEFCNFFYVRAIGGDETMHDVVDGEHRPAVARATNLCHELGQVSYIFSDKTGTLTQNIMDLKMVSIGQQVQQAYGEVTKERGFSGARDVNAAAQANKERGQEISDFFRVLGLAHTVSINSEGELEAESPDEQTLVEAAASCGWRFTGRSGRFGDEVHVETPAGPTVVKVLAVNAFNSDRKRMSIVSEFSDGKRVLLVKGADNVMIGLSKSPPKGLSEHLHAFSVKGLRTLVIGQREVSENEWTSWKTKYDAASNATEAREEQLAKVAAEIEVNIQVLGATAIEDKLQDSVAASIQAVRDAGIKFWMLTGDKLETARSIGFSTSTLDNSLEIVILREVTDLPDVSSKWQSWKKAGGGQELAMMVTGKALEDMTSEQLDEQFLPIAKDCKVVIACRVSPLQKSQMVRLVRRNVKVEGITTAPVTLAIGDGANDVPMIQEAQIGVGIYGREGRQAVNSSDFSISQFKYLTRLLLVHGRWNYRRASKFTLFTFWRNAVQVLLMCAYTFYCGFSGTALFEDNLRITFNGICSIPVLALGIFDQDVSEATALAEPVLYTTGRTGMDLNCWSMFLSMCSALAHSVVIMAVAMAAQPAMDIQGTGDYWTFGAMVYSLLVFGVNYRVAFLTNTWNKWSGTSLALASGMYICYLIVYCFFWRHSKPGTYMVPYHMAGCAVFWVCLFAAPLLQWGVDLAVYYGFHGAKRPDPNGVFAKIDALNEGLRTGHGSLGCRVRRAAVTAGMALTFLTVVVLLAAGRSHGFGLTYGPVMSAGGEWAHVDNCIPGRRCSRSIEVKHDMEPPILVYYSLDPFYQNYNGYFLPPDEMKHSLFNDTFRINGLPIQTRGIAWESDLENLKALGYGEGMTPAQLEHFAVWMRPGGLSTVRKRYGYINSKLTKGQKLQVQIDVNYPVGQIGVTKKLSVTTVTAFGADDMHLANLLEFGVFCCLLVSGIITVLEKASKARQTGTSFNEPLLTHAV